jgi:pectate lyase
VACDGGWVYRQSTLASTLHVSAVTTTTYVDQIVQARVKVLTFGGGAAADGVGVYARFKDLNNYYYVDLRNDGRVAIRMVVSGASTTLPGTAIAAGITSGTWYTIRLSAIGSTLEAYVDGALVASATDTSIAEGGIAVGATNATAEFDDVSVSVP